MVVPFALSIHSFINSVGADVGFASIIGLALLVLLHFAQARETSTLRKRLDESSERIATLEGRLAQALRSVRPVAPGPPTVTPAPAGAGRQMGGAVPSVRRVAGAARPAPAAPMGMAAPALSSATRMITTEPPAPVPTTTPAPVAVPAFAAPVVAAAVGASSAVIEAHPPAHPPAHEPAPDDTLLVAPATAAARGNGHEPTAIASPVAAVGAGAVTAPPPSPPPRVQIRTEPPAGPVRRTAPLPPPQRRSILRRLIPGLLGLVVVAGVVAVLLAVTSSPSQPKTVTTHSHRSPTHRPVVFNPRLVTVAVLNGTGVSHLAADVADKLTHAGYRVPSSTIANAAIQTHTSTIVAYLGHHRADAVEVAKELHLPLSSVAPADHDAIGVCAGGTPGSSCSANVIVTVGTDLSSVAASAGSG